MLVAAALLAGAVRPAAADTCLRVGVRSMDRVAPSLVDLMIHEASSIWVRYGVRIASSAGERVETGCDPPDGSFDVMLERGTRGLPDRWEAVLGRTKLQLRSIEMCPIHIDYQATEQLLEDLPAQRLVVLAGHPDVGVLDVGRALGRVLAHEIGHVLLLSPSHQQHGLMRAAFTSEQLAEIRRDAFTLSDIEVNRLRSRVRALRPPSATSVRER
jgi:hypothetical protein